MYDISLAQETIRILNENGHISDDVQYVTDGTFSCSWDEFYKEASKTYYDSGYGAVEINPFLKVVGDNWWLERHKYDGSEWWEFKARPPREPLGTINIRSSWYDDEEDNDFEDDVDECGYNPFTGGYDNDL